MTSDAKTGRKLRNPLIAAVCCAALLILAASLYLFFGRAETVKNERSPKIGVFIYRGDDTFISNMMDSLKGIFSDFEREKGDHFYLSVQDATNSQTTQNGQIERLLSLGYDVLCVNLVDRTSAGFVVDRAMEANVPVVFFNREPVEADMRKWDKIYYIGTDAVMNGLLEGQIVVDAYKADPAAFDKNGDGVVQYIMIEGEFRHQDAILRTEGSVQTILDAGVQLEKLDGGVANWERSQAAALARDYFEQYGEQIELIICNNDDMALGVLDYIDANGIGFTNVVGIDGTPAGLKAVADGKMLGTVVIDYRSQAQFIFDVTYELLLGRNPATVVSMADDHIVRAPCYIVTRGDG